VKRFFTPLLVFIFGIFSPFKCDDQNPPWQPVWPGRLFDNHLRRGALSGGHAKTQAIKPA
jgi:hypothetical protein